MLEKMQMVMVVSMVVWTFVQETLKVRLLEYSDAVGLVV